MPVNIDRRDYNLDTLVLWVEILGAPRFPTVPGDGYSVHQQDFDADGALEPTLPLTDWTVGQIQQIGNAAPYSARMFLGGQCLSGPDGFLSLIGFFPVGTRLRLTFPARDAARRASGQVDTLNTSVTGIEVPPSARFGFPPEDGRLLDVGRQRFGYKIAEDGDTFIAENPILRQPYNENLTYLAAAWFTVSVGDERLDPTSAGNLPHSWAAVTVLDNVEDSYFLPVGPPSEHWAQIIDRNRFPLETPSGRNAEVVQWQEEIVLITRDRPPEGGALIVDGNRLGINTVERLGRSGFYRVTGTRRYRFVVL